VSQRCGTLSVVRTALRLPLAITLVAALAAPAANAAAPTATTAAPKVSTTPTQPASPGSAFGPLQGLGTGADTSPTGTVTTTKRPDETGLGRGTLLLLSALSLVLIAGVVGLIWYEGRKTRSARKRRQRMRSGRTPQPAAAGAQGRRGPPPPPRKRRAQAKRKKR
jgi:uncharacterized protein HemX